MAEEKSNKVKLGLGEYEIEFDRASLFFFDDMAPRPFARIMIEAEQGLRISDVDPPGVGCGAEGRPEDHT